MVGLFSKKNKEVVDEKKKITVLYDEFEKQIEILRNRLKEKDKVVEGIIIKRTQQTNKIGYPTADIEFNNDVLNINNGFYLSNVKIDNTSYNGISMVYKNNISTHIIEFDKNIYGEKATISIKKMLSPSNLTETNIKDLDFLKQEFDKCIELSKQFTENI